MEITREIIEEAFRNDHAATTVLLASHWLQAHPDDFFVMLNYAEMLYSMTRYEEAIGVYQKALDRVDEDSRWAIYNQLGHLHRYRGHLAEAEPWFQKAIQCEPHENASYIFLGACQARQGMLKEAEATHRAATNNKESYLCDEAYHNLGLVLRGQDQLAEAAECFRKAIEITPKYADAIEALEHVEKALSYVQAGLTGPNAATE